MCQRLDGRILTEVLPGPAFALRRPLRPAQRSIMIAEAHIAAQDTYYNRDRVSIYPLVQEGANVVLDLGCGAGMVGKRLLETKRASSVTGVEIYKPAADEASKWYDRVHQGDIEQMELDYNSSFD